MICTAEQEYWVNATSESCQPCNQFCRTCFAGGQNSCNECHSQAFRYFNSSENFAWCGDSCPDGMGKNYQNFSCFKCSVQCKSCVQEDINICNDCYEESQNRAPTFLMQGKCIPVYAAPPPPSILHPHLLRPSLIRGAPPENVARGILILLLLL